MPRPKYQITDADFSNAMNYLGKRISAYDIEYFEDAGGNPEKAYYKALEHRKKQEAQRVALNAWCEKYLPAEEWTKLKAALRKRRERFERYQEQTTITISTKAHELLVKISERDNVTFTETLEHYLSRAWRASSRKTAKRKKR